uniref:CCHC-type domain-containing protein n=1 Tax=Tanacetum cinerariifolium TaxID=118510 RepID=A0A6L2N9C1_TANCI|nr:hypothetical protein [Tanacetum cinerariifolium]
MVSVTMSADMTLPYEMLLTRLFDHVRVSHPYSFSIKLYLVDHVMIPLFKKRVLRFKHEGKRPRLPTPSNFESFDSPSPTPHQGMENDLVNNFTLDPIPYMNQLLPIEGGESPEFKQTKGMFKYLFHFLSKKKQGVLFGQAVSIGTKGTGSAGSTVGEDTNQSSSPPIAPPESPQMVSSIKLPILKKDEAGNEVEVPPITAQQILARTRQRKAKSTLLMAILNEHLARFHGIKYAKTLWAAIKTRFGDNMDIDDMYNNLKVYEADIKGSSGSSSNSYNAQGFSSYVDELIFSFFANQSSSPQLDNIDLEEIDQDDLEEMDLKWQVAMLSIRVKQFHKKTRRKLEFNGKEPVGFDKTKVECFNCNRRGNFSRDCKTTRNLGNNGRDVGITGYRGRDNGKRPTREEDEKALVVQDGLGIYDWSYQLEEEATDFALMAFISNPLNSSSSNSEVQSCSKKYVQSYEQLRNFFDEQREKLRKANLEIVGYEYDLESIEGQLRVHQQNEVIYEEKIRVLEYDVIDKSNFLKYTQKQLDEALREKKDLKAKLEKFKTFSKNLTKLLDSQISAKVKTGLGYDSQFNEKEVVDVKEKEVTETVFDNRSSDEEKSLANDRFKKSEGFHVVPPPLTGNYMPPKPDLLFAGLDDSIYKFKISETVTSLSKDAPETSTSFVENPKEVRIGTPLIQDWDTDSDNDSVIRPKHIPAKINFVKAGESDKPVKSVKHVKPIKTTEQTEKFKNFSSNPKGHPQQALKNKRIVDSGCSRHMIGNKAYLADCQDINDGDFVAFGLSRNKITSKGGGDSLVRATTTASLDAQQDNSNIAKTQSKATLNKPNPQGEGSGSGRERQETIGGAMAQIRFEDAPIQSSDPPLSTGNTVGSGEDRMEHEIKLTDPILQTHHDSPLSGGHTPGSDEGSMTLKELMNLCTTLSHKVLDLEKVKTAQAKEIANEGLNVVLDEDVDTEVIVKDKGSGEKGGSTGETVSTARPDISAARPEVSTVKPKTPPTTTTLFDDKDVTIVDTLVKMKSQKAKEKRSKGILQEPKPMKKTKKRDQDQIKRDVEVSLKIQAELDKEVMTEREREKEASKAALSGLFDEVQAQIDADHELAARLTHEEQEKYTTKERSKLLAEFFKIRKKQLAKERAKEIRSKPPTKTQLRNLMMTYLKHTGFEEDEKRVGSRKKRSAGSSLKQKLPKKKEMNDQESVDSDKELRKWLKVVPDDEKAINYKTLDVKSTIVDCESHVLGTMVAGDVHVYKLTRLHGNYKRFLTFSRMLKVIDRQDVLDLHKIVIERLLANDPQGYDLILWGDLKTLMESSEDDEI